MENTNYVQQRLAHKNKSHIIVLLVALQLAHYFINYTIYKNRM